MDLVKDGLVLMVLGQLAVFAFLGSMVVLINFNAKWVTALNAKNAANEPVTPVAPTAAATADSAPIAAIAAAIASHQAK